jgi:hypothetical protein
MSVRSPGAVALMAVIAVVSAALAPPAAGQANREKPVATDIGVTPTEIHVATIADVDNPLVPDVFKSAEVSAEAAARFLNSKAGGGGIAGRKVMVDFIDSKLNPNDSRNAVILACENDFAMVGSIMSYFDTSNDEAACPDSQGAPTGIPDMAALAPSVVQSCSPVAFPASPSPLDCSTAQSKLQRYTTNAGIGRYLVRRYGRRKLHGAMIYPTFPQDLRRASQTVLDGVRAAGVKADQYQSASVSATQSDFTPIVQQMKADKSNFGVSFAEPANLIAEARVQGLTGVTWVEDYSLKNAANPVMDGTLAAPWFLPFDEGASNAMLRAYLRYVPRDNRDMWSVPAWAAILAFADAARAVVAKEGVNGLTRKALLHTGIPTLTHFDAGGMIGAVDIAHKIGSPCYLVEQLKGGKYNRVYPKQVGTFDCKKSNLITIQADLLSG